VVRDRWLRKTDRVREFADSGAADAYEKRCTSELSAVGAGCSESIASAGSLGTERHLGLVHLRHGVDLLLLAFGNVLGEGDRIRIFA
jgi:hypothetical protein